MKRMPRRPGARHLVHLPAAAQDAAPITAAARAGSGYRSRRFGGAARHGVRHAAAGYRAAAGESAAPRDGFVLALGAARAGRVLVRPPAARVVFGAEKAGAAGHRHFRHRQRRQYGEAVDAARRALRGRLSRADDAVADLSGLHRLRPRAPGLPAICCRTVRICTRRCSRSSRICRARLRSPISTCSGTAWAAQMRPSSSRSTPREHKLNIHRAVMINPPVSLFASVGRLDKLFAITLGNGDAGVERFYQQLYAALANLYRASDRVEIDEDFLLEAAAAVLRTDARILGRHRAHLPYRAGQHVFRRRPVFGCGRRRRSEPSAAGGRFARTDRIELAQQAVFGIFHANFRSLLLEAPAGFDRGFADRARTGSKSSAMRCAAMRITTRRPTATI